MPLSTFKPAERWLKGVGLKVVVHPVKTFLKLDLDDVNNLQLNKDKNLVSNQYSMIGHASAIKDIVIYGNTCLQYKDMARTDQHTGHFVHVTRPIILSYK